MRRSFLLRPAPGTYPGNRKVAYCIVEPDAPRRAGDVVYLLFIDGKSSLGIFRGNTGAGWPIVATYGGVMVTRYNPKMLHGIYPVTWSGKTPPPELISGSCTDTAVLRTAAEDASRLARKLRHLAN